MACLTSYQKPVCLQFTVRSSTWDCFEYTVVSVHISMEELYWYQLLHFWYCDIRTTSFTNNYPFNSAAAATGVI